MTDHPSSVYDALQTIHDGLATSVSMRSTSPRPQQLRRPPPPKLDHALAPKQSMQSTMQDLDLDLRDLEYSDPDSQLSCPICQVPFVDPVFVDCGHHFCAECLKRYWTTTPRPGDRRTCPTCRATVTNWKGAQRLIVNMCNDVEVKCPMKGCRQTMARGTLGSHLLLYCPERLVVCPDADCEDKVKQKHFLPALCRHKTHLECECGCLIPHEEVETHNEAHCSLGKSICFLCRQPVSSQDGETHTCEMRQDCPGKDFGCDEILDSFTLEGHISSCIMAKMAPHLKAHVAKSLEPLQKELFQSQQRVKGLEEGIDRLLETMDATSQEYKKSPQDETAWPTASHTIANSHSPSQPLSPSSSSSSSWSSNDSLSSPPFPPPQTKPYLHPPKPTSSPCKKISTPASPPTSSD